VHDPKISAEHFLMAGKGSCGPKHYLLAEMFRKLNVSVVYATIAFSWDDQDFHYPPDLRKQAISLPITHHLACRVQIGCRWILVDATWDSPLAKAGFPVNDHWDGYSETRCAVKPLSPPVRASVSHALKRDSCIRNEDGGLCATDGEKNHWDAVDQARYNRQKMVVRTMDEMERIRRFNNDFDAWLAEVRQQRS
jgi:hypothetical protein